MPSRVSPPPPFPTYAPRPLCIYFQNAQPKPVLKSIDNFNAANPEAATVAGSAAATVAAKKKCTRRPDGTAR